MLPWNLYHYYGDTRIIEDNFDAMSGWVDWMRGKATDGLYVRDLLAGLVRVLGPWTGWERVQSDAHHPTGPGWIAALWETYGGLDDDERERVREAGDRREGPH